MASVADLSTPEAERLALLARTRDTPAWKILLAHVQRLALRWRTRFRSHKSVRPRMVE